MARMRAVPSLDPSSSLVSIQLAADLPMVLSEQAAGEHDLCVYICRKMYGVGIGQLPSGAPLCRPRPRACVRSRSKPSLLAPLLLLWCGPGCRHHPFDPRNPSPIERPRRLPNLHRPGNPTTRMDATAGSIRLPLAPAQAPSPALFFSPAPPRHTPRAASGQRDGRSLLRW